MNDTYTYVFDITPIKELIAQNVSLSFQGTMPVNLAVETFQSAVRSLIAYAIRRVYCYDVVGVADIGSDPILNKLYKRIEMSIETISYRVFTLPNLVHPEIHLNIQGDTAVIYAVPNTSIG